MAEKLLSNDETLTLGTVAFDDDEPLFDVEFPQAARTIASPPAAAKSVYDLNFLKLNSSLLTECGQEDC
jgi:hypothetical protein